MCNIHALRFLEPMTFVWIFAPKLASVPILLPESFTDFLLLILAHLLLDCLVLTLRSEENLTSELKAIGIDLGYTYWWKYAGTNLVSRMVG